MHKMYWDKYNGFIGVIKAVKRVVAGNHGHQLLVCYKSNVLLWFSWLVGGAEGAYCICILTLRHHDNPKFTGDCRVLS